jgi:hypothetical protein
MLRLSWGKMGESRRSKAGWAIGLSCPRGLPVLRAKSSHPISKNIGYWMFDTRANSPGTVPQLSNIEYPKSVTPGS